MGDLDGTFDRLRTVLQPFMSQAHVKTDEPGSLYLEVAGAEKPEMFSAVMTKKSYVSFHYMPVYNDPSLLEGLPPELMRRMQGKSCFNFKDSNDPAIAELEKLVIATASEHLRR